MLNYPNAIRVGGTSYDFVLYPTPLEHPRDANTRLNGRTMHDELMMVVYDNPHSPARTEQIFLHEVLEGINNVYELELPHTTLATLAVAWHQALAEAKIDFGKSALNVTTH